MSLKQKRSLRSFTAPHDHRPGRRKTALVTGASSGIGYEFAKLLAAHRYNLILVARNKQRLDDLAGQLTRVFDITVKVLAKDLAQPGAPREIYSLIEKEGIPVDVLINNAGFTVFGLYSETDDREELDMIQVNVTALAQFTKLFLPSMLKRGEGKILNVASTAAFQPGPLMASYYATKSYVMSLSVALADEVKGTGVSVSVLCPGITRTEFHRRARIGIPPHSEPLLKDPAAVARAGYAGMMKGKRVIVPGIMNRIGAVGVRFLPLPASSRIVWKLHLTQKK